MNDTPVDTRVGYSAVPVLLTRYCGGPSTPPTGVLLLQDARSGQILDLSTTPFVRPFVFCIFAGVLHVYSLYPWCGVDNLSRL